jgi:hypothetical protein
MVARRSLIFAATAMLLGSTFANPAFATDDPVAIVNAIYARVAKGKGDGDPLGFDPVTNSQDPDVKSFKVVVEKAGADKATVAVTLTAHHSPRKNRADDVVRYDFVREGGGWKIDDFRGAVDGKPWSVRQLLVNYLKLFR